MTKTSKKQMDQIREWTVEHPWRTAFYNSRARAAGKRGKSYKGIEFTLTKEQVEFMWLRDEAWKLEWPSIDRLDNNVGYIFENCKFIEFIANARRPRRNNHV